MRAGKAMDQLVCDWAPVFLIFENNSCVLKTLL